MRRKKSKSLSRAFGHVAGLSHRRYALRHPRRFARKYEFPADGDYVFKVYPINQGLMDNNRSFGEIKGEKLELMVDGERVKVYDWDKEVATGAPVHGGTADVHFQVKAGLHTVVVTFLATQLAPGSDIE